MAELNDFVVKNENNADYSNNELLDDVCKTFDELTIISENIEEYQKNKILDNVCKPDEQHDVELTTPFTEKNIPIYNCNNDGNILEDVFYQKIQYNETNPILVIKNEDCIEKIKYIGLNWVDNALKSELTYTKAGSISHLLYGEKPSEQSICIKMGRFGEFLSKELIKTNDNLELLTCGIQTINNKKKDVDLIFKDKVNKIIYYRELKGNIELDTEKLPATIAKCKEIENSLKITYLDYTIDCGILNWSVYNRKIITAGLSNIKNFENGGIKINHMEDFLNIINVFWDENDYYSYFREIGTKIRIKFK